MRTLRFDVRAWWRLFGCYWAEEVPHRFWDEVAELKAPYEEEEVTVGTSDQI